MTRKTINLALQGGGAHGAFTWGALDRLLDDERIEIEGITGTSAGALNGAALKAGWVTGGREGAKASLAEFWGEMTVEMSLPSEAVREWLAAFAPGTEVLSQMIEASPAFLFGEALARNLSPYQLNPLNIHPLRPIVQRMLDFDKVCAAGGPKLFVCATNVRSGKVKVFSGDDITEDALLASACLPTLYQAVEIDDPVTGRREAYWDGGYMGNPALFPLFYETESSDIVIVHINPIERDHVPHTAREILNRINEISFNSSLLRELRAIDFVHQLIEKGAVTRGTMKDLKIHSVMDDKLMNQLGVATKMTPDPTLIGRLFTAGHARMDAFLTEHWSSIGHKSSVDLRALFQ